DALRHDPGAVLLLARHLTVPGWDLPALLDNPDLIDEALHLLDEGGRGFVDWGLPAVRPVYHACLAYARSAWKLATQPHLCDPARAWVCGLLAPLGWLARAASDAAAVASCLQDPALGHDPAEVQRRHWGLDHAAVARRLAHAWLLPGWLAAVVGHLNLPG